MYYINKDSKKNCIENWQYFLELYRSCESNESFLKTYYGDCEKISELDRSLISGNINNKDILIESFIEDLNKKYENRSLITCRLGCVESSFIVNKYFKKFIINDNLGTYEDGLFDKHMKSNAGMYYTKEEDKEKVNEWWINNTIELIINKNTIMSSCYMVLAYDLVLMSLLNLKNRILGPWDEQNLLIHKFNNQKILVVSNGVNSMKNSYKNLQSVYNTKLPKFHMEFLYTPQTTSGMPAPGRNMIETTEKILETIDKNHKDFDTALFACGGYTPPLINIISKNYKDKNLLYMGSALYTMFGLYTHKISKPDMDAEWRKKLFRLEGFKEVKEKCPDACKSIDMGKYWKP